jgi:hypothetical protein
LYNTLIGLGRYDDAFSLFYERLEDATHYRLSASRQRVELLEMLFTEGMEQLPHLSKPSHQAIVLTSLALAYERIGQPGRAAALFRRDNQIHLRMGERHRLRICLGNLSIALLNLGAVFDSEAAVRQALLISREQANYSKSVLMRMAQTGSF